jgi:hypothetical protein
MIQIRLSASLKPFLLTLIKQNCAALHDRSMLILNCYKTVS